MKFCSLISLFFLSISIPVNAQIGTFIPVARRVKWTNAGYPGTIPTTYTKIIHLGNEGIALNGLTDVSDAIQEILDTELDMSANGLTLVYFPEGLYRLDKGLKIRTNNVVLKGAGPDYTKLLFRENPDNDIEITGENTAVVYTANPSISIAKDQNVIWLTQVPTNLQPGDYIVVSQNMNMTEICNVVGAQQPSSGIGGCIAHTDQKYEQVVRVTAITGAKLELEDNLSRTYSPSASYPVTVNKILPRQKIGIEDMKLVETVLNNASEGYKIAISMAANVWISGIDSDYTNGDHIGVRRSTKVEVRGCYLHHAVSYGDVAGVPTKGYGIYIGYGSTNCLVEDNILTVLRHMIVLSSSPNRNVIGYNYTDSSAVSQSELICHGFYPHANLFEGNISGYFDIDTYWGYNGPYLTAFRNKLDNAAFCSAPTINIVGNIIAEDVSTQIGGHPCVHDASTLRDRNITEGISYGTVPDISYYLTSRPGFIDSRYTWPPLGVATGSGGPALSGTNPAGDRWKSGGQFTINKRDSYSNYSIQNNGLLSGFNSLDNQSAAIYRNKGYLSLGGGFYLHTTGFWKVAAITTAIVADGKEEIFTAFNSAQGTAVYMTTNKDPNTQPQIFYKANARVTAMASGDFDGNGIDEVVIAYKDQAGKPFLYKTKNLNLYNPSSNPIKLDDISLYTGTSNYWTIDALAAGDFAGSGPDKLITGFNSTDNSTQLYKSGSVLTSVGTLFYSNVGYWSIAALAAGDFDGDGDDELIEGFNSVDGPGVYKSEHADGTAGSIYSPQNNQWRIGALAAGDLDNDGDDELVSAFNPTNTSQGPSIYKSERANDACSVLIYNARESYWNSKALAIEKKPFPGFAGSGSTGSEGDTGLEVESIASDLEVPAVFITPNPTATGMFSVNLQGDIAELFTIRVYTSFGQQILEESGSSNRTAIDLSAQPAGTYFVQVVKGQEVFYDKVIRL